MIKRIEGDAYLVIKDGKIRDLYQGTNAWDNARRRADELDIPGNEDHILIVRIMYGSDGLVEPALKPKKKQLISDDHIGATPSFIWRSLSDRLREAESQRGPVDRSPRGYDLVMSPEGYRIFENAILTSIQESAGDIVSETRVVNAQNTPTDNNDDLIEF
jgi:hypothetical protein